MVLQEEEVYSRIKDLLKLIQECAEMVLSIYNSKSFEIEYKEDESPLTTADKASHALLEKGLSDMFPQIPILSEEQTSEIGYSERKKWTANWCIDPIDGTKEFIKKNGQFAICVGLIVHNKPVFGMVNVPCQRKTYYAAKGRGAWIQHDYSAIKSVSVKNLDWDHPKIATSLSHMNTTTKNFIVKHFGENYTEYPLGSCIKFLELAAGNVDLYIRFQGSMEWDTAACQIIVEEAGGIVMDTKTLTPIKYNRKNLTNNNFIVFAKTDISTIKNRFKQLFIE